jgi:hypothetical protein
MTNTMMAAVAALTFSAAAANAGDLAYLGGVEYAVEAAAFEATAGVEYGIAGVTITPLLTISDATGEFDLAAAELTLSYAIVSAVNAYVTVETNADLEHTETTVGVALRF